MELIKGLYSDLTCRKFGLQYDQCRSDAVIYNAGWYNVYGEKIGRGDLSLKDLVAISRNISDNDVFIVLSESDSIWNVPSNVDQTAPGLDYVMNRARWVISGFKDTAQIYLVSEDLYSFKKINFTSDDENYFYYSSNRKDVLHSLQFTDKKFSLYKETPAIIQIDYGVHHGLDVYCLSDGTAWALASSSADSIPAAEHAARWHVWKHNDLFSLNPRLDLAELRMMDDLTERYAEKSNTLISMIMGSYMYEMCKEMVKRNGYETYLATDGKVLWSSQIKGLPPKFYAFKVST